MGVSPNAWLDELDAIYPHRHESEIPVTIVAAREPPYRYFGRIIDESGKPVAGATVRIQTPVGEADGFDDTHGHHSQTVTGKEGRYDLRAAGPVAEDFEITAPGFPDSWKIFDEAPRPAGRLDFTLPKK